MIKLALGVAMALTVLTGEAQAMFMDGNKLYAICTSSGADYDRGACEGYVVAASDYHEWVRADEHKPRCVPVGTLSQQVMDVVANYLRAHPTVRTSMGVGCVGGRRDNSGMELSVSGGHELGLRVAPAAISQGHRTIRL